LPWNWFHCFSCHKSPPVCIADAEQVDHS
jgi:hypothetical protein